MAGILHPFRRTIEHVYLAYENGPPLVHLSLTPTSAQDPDRIVIMFGAVQSFMDDSFRSLGIGGVRSFEIGKGHHVAFGRGRHILLCVVYRGRESNRLEERVVRHVEDIEARFAPLLRDRKADIARLGNVVDFLVEEWDLPPKPPREPKSVEGAR